MLETQIASVNETRRRVLDFLDDVSEGQSAFKPAPESWCLQEIVEHLALAEEIGGLFIWRAIETPWDGEHPHQGLSIEEVVGKTWAPKVEAPEPARPRFGGPLAYWCARLAGAETMLDELGRELSGRDLARIIYPHVLSGPLDAGQRIDFLRFHMERHLGQMEAVRRDPAFPQR